MYHSGCGWGIEVKFLDFEFLKRRIFFRLIREQINHLRFFDIYHV